MFNINVYSTKFVSFAPYVLEREVTLYKLFLQEVLYHSGAFETIFEIISNKNLHKREEIVKGGGYYI